MVYEAIKAANPDDKLVQLKSLEALQEVAKGDANKIFIPFEATSALSSLGAVKDILTDKKQKKNNIKILKSSGYYTGAFYLLSLATHSSNELTK